ncbi:DUF2141 domain-containing protein [Brumimicrobium aurantiacum]|uniref:DUF2141 domain-containing protein n=1 Tax=Brumimicrobium aurantiacum TaxID=1737063 RepID=A0A3E1F0B6_9FLAO|nr:DUF2141 domain-containing protein [Brumimicrobium aurantiacum]RFC55163.1 DUF2141 domain-containing protein [Brumimicrobium aurantiacum]
MNNRIHCVIHYLKIPVLIVLCISFNALIIVAQTNYNNNTLTVKIKNLNNSKGKVALTLYNSPIGFPDTPKKAIFIQSTVIKDNTAKFQIPNLKEGVYAVSVIHDENNNNKLDVNFVGIPTEGLGVSNDALNKFGPPKFEQAKFKVLKGTNLIIINMYYY